MSIISISELKTNPAKAIEKAADMPVAIKKRNKTAGYVVGKDIFEKLVSFVEDYIDRKAISEADYKRGKPLQEVIKELGLE